MKLFRLSHVFAHCFPERQQNILSWLILINWDRYIPFMVFLREFRLPFFSTIIIRQSPSLPRSNEEERQDGSYLTEHQPGGQSPYLLEHLESISRARLENLKISISGKLWLTAVDRVRCLWTRPGHFFTTNLSYFSRFLLVLSWLLSSLLGDLFLLSLVYFEFSGPFLSVPHQVNIW